MGSLLLLALLLQKEDADLNDVNVTIDYLIYESNRAAVSKLIWLLELIAN